MRSCSALAAAQALTILLSFPIFHTEPTPMLLLGIAVTCVGTAAYAYFKHARREKRSLDCAGCTGATAKQAGTP